MTLTHMIDNYNDKHGYVYDEERVTHIFSDGSELEVTVAIADKEIELWCPDDKEKYSANVLTKRWYVNEFGWRERRFNTKNAAIKYFYKECEKIDKAD